MWLLRLRNLDAESCDSWSSSNILNTSGLKPLWHNRLHRLSLEDFPFSLQVSYKYPTANMSNPTQRACSILGTSTETHESHLLPSVVNSYSAWLHLLCFFSCWVLKVSLFFWGGRWVDFVFSKSRVVESVRLFCGYGNNGLEAHLLNIIHNLNGSPPPKPEIKTSDSDIPWMSPIPNGWRISIQFEWRSRWHISFLLVYMNIYIYISHN